MQARSRPTFPVLTGMGREKGRPRLPFCTFSKRNKLTCLGPRLMALIGDEASFGQSILLYGHLLR